MSLSFLSADEAVKQLIMSRSSTVEVSKIDQKLTPWRTFVDFGGIMASQMLHFVRLVKKRQLVFGAGAGCIH